MTPGQIRLANIVAAIDTTNCVHFKVLTSINHQWRLGMPIQ